MPRIRLLPDHLVNQIAAGEVVERPASVVKELVENSLDAGARAIRVSLAGGGRDLVEVTDDGCGMDRDDALLCLDRHATSKLSSADDLASLATLGFRGEALPSIAAACRLTLETAAGDGEGTRVVVEFGAIRAVEPCARGRGTRVVARDLFDRLPARRKFLRSEQTELRHAVATLSALAFATPEVAFALTHGSRSLLALPAVPDGGRRLADLFGAARARAAVAVRHAAGDIAIRGFLLPPTASRDIVLVVNGRTVRDRMLVSAVARAVRGPSGALEADVWLEITVPAEAVDVNVHPAKTEVRFAEPGRIASAVAQAVAAARPGMHTAVPVRRVVVSGAPPWPPAPGARLPFPAAHLGLHRTDLAVREVAPSDSPLGYAAPASAAERATPFGRYIGQYRDTYLLLEDEYGLLLVDQHVAHERVLYERLLAAPGPLHRQRLLVPEIVELPPALAAAAGEIAVELESVGVEIEPASGNTLRVLAMPADLPASDAAAAIARLLGDITDGRTAGATVRERAAASLSCQAAIKKNRRLDRIQAEALLAQLAALADPHRCPHGRPIVLRLPHDEIERRIGRR